MSVETEVASGTPNILRLSVSGEPTLIVSTTSNYTFIYKDKGSGASEDVSIWRPTPSSGYWILGDYAQGNYMNPTGAAMIVMVINDDPDSPLLKAATGFTQVWNDKKSGGDQDGSIWAPIAPDGYVAIGHVGQNGYNAPNIPNYACFRRDLVTITNAGAEIWKDKGSGASEDVTLWQIVGVPNAFVSQGNYQPFSGTVFMLKS